MRVNHSGPNSATNNNLIPVKFVDLATHLIHLSFTSQHLIISSVSVLPLRGSLRLRGSDAEPAVLLAVDVPPLRRLDAHPRGVPQLEVEGLRVLRVGAEAVVVEVQVLAVLT